MRRLLEVAVVIAVIAVSAAVLLQRLQEVRESAARVQLRMGAEAVRLNALLFQARCGAESDAACWQGLLATRQDALSGTKIDAGAAQAPATLPDGTLGLLHSVALAAGLGEDPAWQLHDLAPEQLQFALQNVAHCRFVLALSHPSRQLRVESLEDRCCSRASCA